MSFLVLEKYINCFSDAFTIAQCASIVAQQEFAGKLYKAQYWTDQKIILCISRVKGKQPANRVKCQK